jgi:tetratricopeptide (TPR) repeat protein
MSRSADPLHAAIRRYAAAIRAAEQAPTAHAAWAVASARDGLDTALGAGHATEGTQASIVPLDRRARMALARTPASALPAFEAMRDARGKRHDQWWWTPSGWVARSHHAFLKFGMVTCWGLALTITSNTIGRWLTGAPDWTSIVAIVIQALITMLGGAAFVEQGRGAFLRLTALLSQPIGRWQQLAILGTCAVLVAVLAVRWSLPAIATLYSQQGQTHFDAGRLANALDSWRRAVALDPDPWEYRYQLGSGLERQADTEGAIAQYRLAVAAPEAPPFVVNNLARLYLVQKNDAGTALTLLEPALRSHEQDGMVRYRMLINRGAAFLALKLPNLARFDGAAAMALAKRLDWAGAPSASCLLAIAEDDPAAPAPAAEWTACLQPSLQDEVSDPRWIAMARERLWKEAR